MPFYTLMTAQKVSFRFNSNQSDSDSSLAHTDAVWGVSWTKNDTVVSISADGSIKQWTSSSGALYQPSKASEDYKVPSPHTLGLVSLSVSPDGQHALYNSLEGLTCLWNLETGKMEGTFESYVRAGENVEPCEFA